jgi:hypothetical protein
LQRITLIAIRMMFLLGVLRAADEFTPVGFIQKLSGDVWICGVANCDAGPAEVLKPDRDEGRILFENQSLKCTGGGKAFVRTSPALTVAKEFAPDICKSGKNSWQHMPTLKASERIATVQGFDVALKQYGRRAGRDKGSESPIYSPPDKGAVIVSDFMIRWRTKPPLNKIAVSLLDGQGKVIARLENVDGNSGLLDSAAFREALATYRDSADPHHEAHLVFKTEDGTDTGVEFSVLSRTQEKDLRDRLKQVDSSHGLFQYVERAAIYESLQMYDKVASEYDSALKEAPGSHDMLQAAFNAHARIGDLRQARELRDKLDEINTPREKP